ncbi:MAG: hotdog fold thioesterase [Alicyclobacillus sp.]|nr:hotdog fold thioesterase [Alicyclobacillus sp.]
MDDSILKHTLMETLGMHLVEATADKVIMTMPVDHRTVQPMGLLHGGASLALAESAASLGTVLNIDTETQAAVGLEINGNHIRSARSGTVTAVATPIHRGRTTMVWDIRITDDHGHLLCISRCTVAIINRRTSAEQSSK